MFAHEFMRNALIAGTFIGAACGLVGYPLVLRAQVFAGDALGHVAFAGALAAAAIGIDIRVGLFAATIVVALAMGGLGERAQADDVTIGTVFAWVLGLGVLFLAIFTTSQSAGNGTAAVRVLFGSIFGLSGSDTMLAAVIALAAVAGTLAIARPLLFASIDPDVASAHGVPVRLVGLVFLAVLGVVGAEATQAVGALLLLGLVAAPAAAAHRVTRSPYAGLALSAGFAVSVVWAGLALAYLVPSVPPSTAIIGLATVLYATAAVSAPFVFSPTRG
ncbi:MAG TPA: metal ABC transporter permease [Gaiellaceae bacterium]